MGFPSIIALIFFVMIPIFGPFNSFMFTGLLLWPYLAGRWVYDRFDGNYWIGAALLALAAWVGVIYGWLMWIVSE